MAPIQDFYNNEFLRTVTVQKKNNARVSPFNVIVEFISKVHFDFESNSKFISFYIPESQYAVIVCTFLLKNINDTLGITDGITTAMGHPGQDFSHSQDLQFSKRVYIYTDNIIGESERLKIREFWKQAGLSLILRDKSYAEQAEITPLAFISHDSRNKDEIARPLAIELTKLLCPVWFDEFSLRAGDSLRESIEKGLKECKKCILILTKEFLSNDGWTKTEFNSIFTREILEREKVILPIWHDVSERAVYEYSPALTDKVALSWKIGAAEVARRLCSVIKTE